jgi:hypothetical protein
MVARPVAKRRRRPRSKEAERVDRIGAIAVEDEGIYLAVVLADETHIVDFDSTCMPKLYPRPAEGGDVPLRVEIRSAGIIG